MTTIAHQDLSGLVAGAPLLVTATTSGAAQTVHTADANADDEVFLYAWNTHTAAVEVTLEIDGTAQPMVVPVPHDDGEYLLLDALRLSGSKTIEVFASVASVIKLRGHANRVSSS